jgi:hypothetical protein
MKMVLSRSSLSPANKVDAPNIPPDQKKEGERQPSVLETVSEKEKS